MTDPAAGAAVIAGEAAAIQAPPPEGASARARAAAGEALSLAEAAAADAAGDPHPAAAADAAEAEPARATLPRLAELEGLDRLALLRAAPEALAPEALAADPGLRTEATPVPAAADLAARAPQAARAAPPVQVAWPVRQVAPFAVALALGPDSSLTLMLDPVELGRVEVSIDRSRGEAAIRVTAERPETLALLQRDARELERALADAGFGDRGPTLSFSLSQGHPNPNQGNPNQGRPDQSGAPSAQSTRGEAGRQAANDSAMRALPPRRSSHPGLIDLAV